MSVNPIVVYREKGEEGVRKLLNDIDNENIIHIIRAYMPDMTRNIYRSKDREKLIKYVVYRASKLAEKGSVFMT